MVSENDGSFRRLVEMVRNQDMAPTGKPGRPPKHRIATTGHFAETVHSRMKLLAKARTAKVDHLVSTSDLYNEAATLLVTDLHKLLGDDLRLPAGAVSVSGVLGLRELISRPVLTHLRQLAIQSTEQKRTTLYLDQPVWDALLEMSMLFGLQMRKAIHVHRLIELGAAWFLAGIDFDSIDMSE